MATRTYSDPYSAPPRGRDQGPSGLQIPGALRRHWRQALLPLAALLALALLIGLLRPANYTAQARLNVGRLDVATQSIPGFVEGSQQLAASYSQSIDAQAVLEPLSNQLDRPASELGERLSGSAVPDSPTFIVEAVGDDPNEAVTLANLGSRSLVDYVTRLNSSNPNGRRLIAEFNEAARDLTRARARQDRLQAQLAANPSETTRTALAQATADVETAQLRRETLRSLYKDSQQGQLSIDVLQVLSPATNATSDRRSVLQLLLFLALVAGALAAVALAVWRDRQSRVA